MMTTPITTPHFQSRVQALLSTYHSELLSLESDRSSLPLPLIPALSPADSTLTPHDGISQLIAVTSSWIDLCSPDTVIASLSLQVFTLEIAYAAFCGIQNVLVRGPFLPDGSVATSAVALFARAIEEAITVAPYIHFQIVLPMYPVSGVMAGGESGHLSNYAIKPSGFQMSTYYSTNIWAAWEAWDMIRATCKYHSRVSMGKSKSLSIKLTDCSLDNTETATFWGHSSQVVL
jgi:protein arginine N-methyltransferase 5